MLLENKDGIKCDKCSEELRIEFIYYSIDIIKNNSQISSMDFCENCFNKLYSFVKDNLKCEMCGIGDREFDIKIDEVEVDVFKYVDKGRKIIENLLRFSVCEDCLKRNITKE